MSVLGLSFVIVFVAEFGDKTQLLTLVLTARYGARAVLVGVTIATAMLSAASVVVGAALRHLVSVSTLSLVAGIVFCGMAVWIWWSADSSGDDSPPRRHGAGAVATAALVFLLSEVGDKTMIATVALAAGHPALPVWLGATMGVVAAEAVAVVIGKEMADHVASRVVRGVTTGVFAIAGLGFLVGGAITR